MLKTKLFALGELFIDFFGPPRCIACTKGNIWLCRSCQFELGDRPALVCPSCSDSSSAGVICVLCRQLESPLDQLVSAFNYEDVTFHKVLAVYKENGNKKILPFLSDRLASVIKSNVDSYRNYTIVFIPASKKRIRERGFDQSKLLAHAITRTLKLPDPTELLKRNKPHKSQKELSAMDRRQELKRAYQLNDARIPTKILIVDDIATSLATLETCASLLRRAGARRVIGTVLAHAEALTSA